MDAKSAAPVGSKSDEVEIKASGGDTAPAAATSVAAPAVDTEDVPDPDEDDLDDLDGET